MAVSFEAQKTLPEANLGPCLFRLGGQRVDQPGALDDEVRAIQRDGRRPAVREQFEPIDFVGD